MSFSSKIKDEIKNRHFTRKTQNSTINISNRDDTDGRLMLAELFLKGGTISNPEKSYHMEFICDTKEEADKAASALSELGIIGGETMRKGRYCIYLKDSEAISETLAAFEAYNALLEFENIRAMKEMVGSIQRRVNFETANITRTVSASMRQLEDIRYIADTIGLKALPEALRVTAELRLRYPEATLKELAEYIPDIGKPGINHRLRRLSRIAADLKAGKETAF